MKLKNHSDRQHKKAVREPLDAKTLKRRAAEDALSDADSFAFSRRPQGRKPPGANGPDPDSSLPTARRRRVLGALQDRVDGLLIHSNGGGNRLVLSDEMLEISLPDEAAALVSGPVTIFHVAAPAFWVQHVWAGNA